MHYTELTLIEHLRRRAARTRHTALKLGIGDDCAILTPPPGQDLVVTTDLSLEGRHFRRDWHPAASAGHRTLARGLSDLAAMGAKPLAAFLSIAIPKHDASKPHWLNDYLEGLLALAEVSKTPLAGGDTSQSPDRNLLADITLLGATSAGKALRRSTARPGDLLYVTGALGGAAAQLHLLSRGARLKARSSKLKAVSPNLPFASRPDLNAWPSLQPALYPQPRLAVGQALLRRHLATACIDTSDGLSTDLHHLCRASNVAAELDLTALPLHPMATQLPDRDQITALLHGGEDYELLFTAHPTTKVPRQIAGIPITHIGRILKPQRNRPNMSILDKEVRYILNPQGFQHLT